MLKTQEVVRPGTERFDRKGNRVEDGPATSRDLIVIPTIPLQPREETTQSPTILSRAEIARRRDANNGGA